MKKTLLLMLLLACLAACNNGEEKTDTPQVTFIPNEQNSSTGTTTAPQILNAGQGTLSINVTMPNGYKFNNAAPFSLYLTSTSNDVSFDESWEDYQTKEPTMPIDIPLVLREGSTLLTLEMAIYWCEAIKETLCFVERQNLTVPVSVTANAGNSIAQLEIPLIPPEIAN